MNADIKSMTIWQTTIILHRLQGITTVKYKMDGLEKSHSQQLIHNYYHEKQSIIIKHMTIE